MSHLVDALCLFVLILGIVLSLYGANYYDAVIGWIGVYLFIGGILVWLFLYVYERLKSK
jgi:divalent metal cation (Fe/Co/Zn/Cd) transporter